LHWRSTPDGQWTAYTPVQLTLLMMLDRRKFAELAAS
jgi:hypothetical protein